MQEHISVATLNVRSLRSELRAQSVLTFLEGVSADIICLQECGLPFRSSYGEWERKWPHGPSLWSGSEENPADGVAILVRNRGVEVVGSTVVCCGRALLVSLSFHGVLFHLLNVYCSPQKQARWELLQVLREHLDKTSTFLRDMAGDCRMVDVFRSLHPGREGFTWASADGSRASRIDFLFARGFVGVSASLAPVYFSDHSLLLCSLAVGPGVSVGRGAWRLNCSLLESQVVREAFRAQYAHWQTLQGLYGSRAEWWEEVKGRVKGFFVVVGKERRAKERRVWAGLQRRLNRYFSLLHGGFDFRAEVEEVKREMAAIAARRSQSIIFRSKEREVDEGETCSRFFFKKVMARGTLMKGLKGRDGVTLTSTEGQMKVVEGFFSDLFGEKPPT
ncbi:hypothetical protein AAFF_G00020050 [Aldrovandia affinis]|uniref:exodeoxyribonuclease III n=1 Tax=Aldrovandia affinis TaxID=143900 RepID=A0AAD7R332_9TELE|nr:hypothetical protein AAFF_G00020050 [Aldrovandia affinis]